MRPRAHRRSRAFTLLEVSVALAILATALLVLLDGVRTGTQAFFRTRSLLTAQSLARRVMTESELSDDVPLDDEVENGEFEEAAYEGYSYEIHYKVNENIEMLRTLAPELTQTIFLVTVVIKWEEDGLPEEYELKTLRLYPIEGLSQTP